MSLVTAPLSLLGAGGSTYDRKPYENAVNRFKESYEANALAKPEDAAKVAATLKNISNLESKLKTILGKVEAAEAQGKDTSAERKGLEDLAQRIAVEKGKALEFIRSLR